MGNMLNGHPNLDWQSEVFHSFHESPKADRNGDDPFQILQDSISRSKKRAYGFETKFQHLDSNGLKMGLSGYLTKLREMGFEKFILLERKNYVRQAISVARGQMTQTWHVTEGREKPQFSKFELNLDEISLGGVNRKVEDCFRVLDETYQATKELFRTKEVDFLSLNYEADLENDASIGLKKSLSFLQLKQVDCAVSLQRLDARPVSEMIENFKELRSRIGKTSYGWMCES